MSVVKSKLPNQRVEILLPNTAAGDRRNFFLEYPAAKQLQLEGFCCSVDRGRRMRLYAMTMSPALRDVSSTMGPSVMMAAAFCKASSELGQTVEAWLANHHAQVTMPAQKWAGAAPPRGFEINL